MNVRPLVATVLVLALLAAPSPRASAQTTPVSESGTEGRQTDREPMDVLAVTSRTLARPGLLPSANAVDLFARAPANIRLSRGAKTALIVTAIVVGVLVIAGVVVIAKPHKP